MLRNKSRLLALVEQLVYDGVGGGGAEYFLCMPPSLFLKKKRHSYLLFRSGGAALRDRAMCKNENRLQSLRSRSH